MLRRWLRLRPLNAGPHVVHGPEAYRPFVEDLVRRLGPGDVVYLQGPIGAGKTTFAQALAASLGVTEAVTSPTYVLVHRYPAPVPVVHLDLYRLEAADERSLADVAAEIDPAAIALIEWPEVAAGSLPRATWTVRLSFADGDVRRLEIVPGD